MMTTLDRRNAERARIPCNIPVELTDPQHAAQFEADAVDLSVGGLSLRTSSLPELGSQLICSFEAIPGGATVLGRGEVVWRKAMGDRGERVGEFGLRFIEVDPKNQALIDEMVSERVARIDIPCTAEQPVLASLELDGGAEPIAVKLVRTCAGEALFEQPLDLLQLGRSVVAHAGVSLLRGKLSSVQLRLEGPTPTLSLSVRLAAEPARFGEFDWGPADSDTDPDVFAHGVIAEDPALAGLAASAGDADRQSSPAGEGTLAGIGSPFVLPAAIMARHPEDEQLPLVFRRPDPDRRASDSSPAQLALSHASHADDDDDDVEEDEPAEPAHHDEPDRVFADEDHALELITSAHLASFENELPAGQKNAMNDDTWAHQEIDDTQHSPLVRALALFASVSEHANQWIERAQRELGQLRGRSGQRVVSGSGRNTTWNRPRRVTAGSSERDPDQRNLWRVLGIALMTITAVALFVYALAPSSSDQRALRPPVVSEHGLNAATDPALAGSTTTLTNTAGDQASGPAGQLADGPAKAQPTSKAPPPSAASAANPSAASANELHAKAKALALKPTAARPANAVQSAPAPYYGQKQVANARRFLLRLSAPVKLVQGSAVSDGFSVVISGARALDKAAPIVAGHPGIARAVILNHNDQAELSVRFAPGKHPAYRVAAQGAALEVLLGP
jgi:PilZ domain